MKPLHLASAAAPDYDLEFAAYGSEDELVWDIIGVLETTGLCILRGMLARETVSSISSELAPYLKSAEGATGEFWPKQTTTLNAVLSKSRTFAVEVVGHPTWHTVAEHFLDSTLREPLPGAEDRVSVSKPQLNNATAFKIGPGAKDQGFHRDDIVHHTWNGHADAYQRGRDTGLGIFVPLTKTCRANGATRFIPGSHLWDYGVAAPENNDTAVYLELNPGDCFMMLASVYHGGSANTTQDHRIVCVAAAIRGYLRQEENQYLSHSLEQIRALPLRLQRFVGYSTSAPFTGYVNMKDPIHILSPELESAVLG